MEKLFRPLVLRPLVRIAGATFTIAVFAIAGCSDESSVEVQSDDFPTQLAVIEARDEARRTVGEFLAALQNPRPGQTEFFVKARFEEGERVEHLWLRDPKFEDGKLVGRVAYRPTTLEIVRVGDEHAVAPQEIYDWVIVENSRRQGGFLEKVLQSRRAQSGR